MNFENRQGTNLNRKRIKIISQTPTEIIADIERADNPTVEGTDINATVFNNFQNEINTAKANSVNSISIANNASSNSSTAISTANSAKEKSTIAETNSANALIYANSAETNSSTALTKATTAESNASSALTKASNAEANANNALTKANSSISTSENALNTANSADANASSALTKATTAIDAFNNFQATSEILKVAYSPSIANWACSEVNTLPTTFGVNSTVNSNVKFSSEGSAKTNVVIDGDFFGQDGQKKVAYRSDIPTKTSNLTNDSNFITASANITGNANTATTANKANYLTGFNNATTSQTWVNQTGTFICGMDDSTSGSLAFRRDNPSSGKLSMIIDGTVYVNEGNDQVATLNGSMMKIPVKVGTDSSLSSYWFPLWKQHTKLSQYNDVQYKINIGNRYNDDGMGHGVLAFGFRNNSTDQSSVSVQLEVESGNLDPSRFKMYKRSDNLYELWCYAGSQWAHCIGEVFSIHHRTGHYTSDPYGTFSNNVFSSVQTPSGTEIACSSQTIKGNLTVSGYINANSDIRLKNNIENIDERAVKEFIESIQIKAFNYNLNNNRTIGIIAQDIENISINDAFFTNVGKDNYLEVHETKFTYLLWNYCQQLNQRIKKLENILFTRKEEK